MKNLRIVLGDQLSHSLTALQGIEKDDLIILMEVWDETQYVNHHQKKIAFIFSCMRHFAHELGLKRHNVKYIELDSLESLSSFTETLNQQIKKLKPSKVICTEPSEYRVLEMMMDWSKKFDIPVEIRIDNRFFVDKAYFNKWAAGKNQLRMENFYHNVRKLTGILMLDGHPLGGKWNYDSDNRKTLKDNTGIPDVITFEVDKITKQVLDLVNEKFKEHFGTLENFNFAVTKTDALKALDHFIKHRLANFGDFQDAMLYNENVLFHSQLSQYINIGLLLPDEVCRAVEHAHYTEDVSLNSAEGFIRQILGWREFMRGVYWLKMPQYAEMNTLQATHPLPAFYWNGKAKMRCMEHALSATHQYALSHHIQRLMITGNFALVYGADPKEVCEWYLAVYADAYEWVELPNTLGMSLFGDGGFLASKPYASSGAYINKMSNFCKECVYSVKERLGDDACPFNFLYWDFLIKNANILKNNQRMKFAYLGLSRMTTDMKEKIVNQANSFRTETSKEKY